MKLPPAARTPALDWLATHSLLGWVPVELPYYFCFESFVFYRCADTARPSLSLLLSPRPTSRATHVSQHLHLPAGVQRIVRSIVAERAGSQIPEGAVPAAARGACEWPCTCAGLAPPSRHNPSHLAIAAGPVLRTQWHDVPMEVHALCLPPRASVRSCLQTARKPKARVLVVRVDRLQLRG